MFSAVEARWKSSTNHEIMSYEQAMQELAKEVERATSEGEYSVLCLLPISWDTAKRIKKHLRKLGYKWVQIDDSSAGVAVSFYW